MTRLRVAALAFALLGIASSEIVKRQTAADNEPLEDEADAFTKELCKDKGAGEWFRLTTTDCRDVIQCTDAGLQALRCPHGLAFNLELQTCDWKENVKNCAEKEKKRVAKPLLNTVEPLCQDNLLACGDGTCLDRQLFCNGEQDCSDGSDENACGVYPCKYTYKEMTV